MDTYSRYDCFANNGGVVMEEIKVEEIHEILKTILTLIQYVKLLELMLKDCELFTVQDDDKSSR